MSKTFTLDEKKRFNGTIEHIDNTDNHTNDKSKFINVDEELLMAEGEDKVGDYTYTACQSNSYRLT